MLFELVSGNEVSGALQVVSDGISSQIEIAIAVSFDSFRRTGRHTFRVWDHMGKHQLFTKLNAQKAAAEPREPSQTSCIKIPTII